MNRIAPCLARPAPLVACVFVALCLAGCVQAPRTDFAGPSASAVAKTEPMDLSATATPTVAEQPVKTTKRDKTKPSAKEVTADPAIAGTGEGITTDGDIPAKAVASKAKEPVAEDPPASAAIVPPAAASAAVDPQPIAKAVRDDGFPNINMPPEQPSGKLLSAEERAKVISELEALRNRQGVAPQTPAKKPAKKCTDQQIAAGETGCPAPASN